MQVVCPQNATKTGCSIYWTGSDVSSLYSQATGSLGGRRLQSTRRMLDCSGSAGAGDFVSELLLAGKCCTQFSDLCCNLHQRWSLHAHHL